jgi:outer membrane murein-binding lipoprotein Lpp
LGNGTVVGLAAVILAVLIAQVSLAGGGSDQTRIERLERQVAHLQAAVSGEAQAAKKKKKQKRGPQGPPGPQGIQGPVGAAGSGAGGMQMGWVNPSDLPSAEGSLDYSPFGSSEASIGGLTTPNSTVVIRDLFVRVNAPAGLGNKWVIALQGNGAEDLLTCEIASAVATSCNSGAQTVTIPPGGDIRLLVENDGDSNLSEMYYAYRVGSP